MGSADRASALHVVMIKPSHYDDDGYPITWLRSIAPSNTLAVLHGLVEDCRRRRVLGDGVDIVPRPIDETNRRVRPDRIVRDIRRAKARALICLVGVQSNQFPRAVDLARPFLAAGLPVIVGGFHVSGCLSMLKETPAEIREAMEIGIAMFAGEAEDQRLDEVLRDAWAGRLKPLYNHLDDLPDLAGAPRPTLPAGDVAHTISRRSSFDLGRGCPFQCSFCTIINVQGRKSRFRTADDLEAIVRENARQGIRAFFITDDNLARNRLWESFFDRLHALHRERLYVDLVIQVDTQCHKIPNFIRKARLVGVNRVFIGLENINPDNLLAAKKRQNKITEYREMLQQWHAAGVFTWVGSITGFPADTRESLLRDIEIIKNELPVDMLEIFVLTPLPGSEDHRTLLQAGAWMDPDLNKYDQHHRVTHHGRMTDTEWEDANREAWRSYYSWKHIETVARRHAADPEGRPGKVVQFMTEFKIMVETEGVHPLDGGILRLKYRRDRRPGLPVEPPLLFHLRLAAQFAWKHLRYAQMAFQGWRIARRVAADPARLAYRDAATAPVDDREFAALALYRETAGGDAAVDNKRRDDRLRAKVAMSRSAAE